MPEENYDIIIIGGGPAGLTSAIYTSRADFETLVVDKGDRLLEKAEAIENYFGFPESISGKEILERGRRQAEKFGTEIVEEEALIVKMENEEYVVETTDKDYRGEGLILAPGIQHQKPSIEGLKDLEGQGISYCVTCDAPFFKNKKVGILGSEDYAAKEALELYEFTEDVYIFTNGEDWEARDEIKKKISEKEIPIIKEKIKKVKGEESLQSLVLENKEEKLDGLFVAVGTSGSINFAKSLGIPVEENTISVNEDLSANLPKLYAAGDCTGGTRQLAIAVGEGAKAALNLIEDLRESEYVDWKKKG